MTISYRVRKQIVDYFAQRKSSQEIASMLNVSLDQIQDWHFFKKMNLETVAN